MSAIYTMGDQRDSGEAEPAAALPFQMMRYQVIAETANPYMAGRVSDARDLAAVAVPMLIGEPNEAIILFGVTTTNRIIGAQVIYRGTVNACSVSAREVFLAALLMPGCARIFLAHNHPSGEPTPSTDDHCMTGELIRAGRLLGIELIDHIVVGTVTGAWKSIREINPMIWRG